MSVFPFGASSSRTTVIMSVTYGTGYADGASSSSYLVTGCMRLMCDEEEDISSIYM